MPIDQATRYEHQWGLQSSPELSRTIEADGSILVVPIGSMEQHGHHLPLATDTILVDEMANRGVERVAEEIPVVTLPPVWAALSPHHADFAGTVTVTVERLRAYVEDVVSSGLSHGFDAVLLVNGHGGNKPLVGTLVNTLGASNPDREILGVTYFDLAEPFIEDVRDSDPGGMGHGGEFETSLMLYFYPEFVDEDEIDGTVREEPYDHAGREMFRGGPLSVYRPFSAYGGTGAIGEPELASAEKGETIAAGIADELGEILLQIHHEAGG
jgi:creatinine amidohydrolase